MMVTESRVDIANETCRGALGGVADIKEPIADSGPVPIKLMAFTLNR